MIVKHDYPKVNTLEQAVLQTNGASPLELRQRIADYARNPDNDNYPISAIPEELRSYIDKVVRFAYRITDADMQALKDYGYSEEYIFEITVTAALGASLRRFRKALHVLE